MLNIIHESFDAIPITQNDILQFYKILYVTVHTFTVTTIQLHEQVL